MSITPMAPADFSPNMLGYSGQGAFRFWCQQALPLVYDDSLSYYELLNKVVHYLNNTIQDVANTETNVANLKSAYDELQGYVNTYFDSLDVQEEINTKLNTMASDGSLTNLISPYIPNLVTGWLDEHVTPTSPVVDNTLSISGAAADAKATGDAVSDLKTAIEYAFVPSISKDAARWEKGAFNEAGGLAVSAYVIRSTDFYLCNSADILIRRTPALDENTNTLIMYVAAYDAYKNGITRILLTYGTVTKLPTDTKYIKVSIGHTVASGVKVDDYGFDNLLSDYDVDIMTDVQYELPNKLSITGDGLIAIPEGMDYDVLTIPGMYVCSSAELAKSMVNCPSERIHVVLVLPTTKSTSRPAQIIVEGAGHSRLYVRTYNTVTGFSDWLRYLDSGDLDTTLFNTYISVKPDNLINIPNETDYNDITDIGAYQVLNSAMAKTMHNCPVRLGHRLYVYKIHAGSSYTFQTIISIYSTGATYTRRLDKQGNWTSWSSGASSGERSLTPVYTQYTNVLPASIGRIMAGGLVVGATLPMESSIAGTTLYYDSGSDINGVIYSSVWRDGLDVFRNLTLETFYSALNNPTSVLYTEDYTDRNYYNAHTYYGGVCSTFVSQALGMRLYHTTAQLQSLLTPKSISNPEDIALGDILLKNGHIALISQLLLNQNGVLDSVIVAEETSPEFRTTVVPLKDFDNYCKMYGYRVMTRPSGSEITAMDSAYFSQDVLYERGNNTYVTVDELSDGAWFYFPDTEQKEVYYKKPGDDTLYWIGLTGVNTKTVNGYTVYDLSPYLTAIGSYEFFADADSAEGCRVKVIDTGSATLSGNTLSLAGWGGCFPYNYYIVREEPVTSGSPQTRGFSPSSDNYYCIYDGRCAEIDLPEGATSINVTIPANLISGYSRYKCWIEYQTGCGLKQVFSNVVQL